MVAIYSSCGRCIQMRGPTSTFPYFLFNFSFVLLFCVEALTVTLGPEGPTSLNPSPCIGPFDSIFGWYLEPPHLT